MSELEIPLSPKPWAGNGCSGKRMLLETDDIMVWASMFCTSNNNESVKITLSRSVSAASSASPAAWLDVGWEGAGHGSAKLQLLRQSSIAAWAGTSLGLYLGEVRVHVQIQAQDVQAQANPNFRKG